jgi:hypothetical protein
MEDLDQLIALFRPGPMRMIDEYLQRRAGTVPVRYPLPQLEAILKPTYGVIVYQEQVMRVAMQVSGMSAAGADLLLRAMGKKDPELLEKQRAGFIAGAAERGVARDKADELFDLLARFAEYGFNKAHSAAYAVLRVEGGVEVDQIAALDLRHHAIALDLDHVMPFPWFHAVALRRVPAAGGARPHLEHEIIDRLRAHAPQQRRQRAPQEVRPTIRAVRIVGAPEQVIGCHAEDVREYRHVIARRRFARPPLPPLDARDAARIPLHERGEFVEAEPGRLAQPSQPLPERLHAPIVAGVIAIPQ